MVTQNKLGKRDYTFMQDSYGGGGDSWQRSEGWRKRRVRRGRVSLTQFFESQEDQDITRLLNFTRTQERGRNGVFLCLGMKEMGCLYSSNGGNMNERPFNEG